MGPNRDGFPFLPAVKAMRLTGNATYGPRKFLEYVDENFPDRPERQRPTPAYLSVQSRADFDKESHIALRDAGIMIFRLGPSNGARFALIRAKSLDDFFLTNQQE